MKLKVENEILLGTAEDWKKLEYNERTFLSKIVYECLTYINGNGELEFMTKCYQLPSLILVVKKIVSLAKEYLIEIDESVNEYINALIERKREEDAAFSRQFALTQRLEKWERRQKLGCDGCKYLEQYDGVCKCRYSEDDLDTRITQYYNAKNRVYELFHETGIPNEHCIEYVQIIKKSEERYGKI